MRGGERVLETLLELFPSAEIYTLFYDPRGLDESINGRVIHTSALNRLPAISRHYPLWLPFFPAAAESLRPTADIDLTICISHCAAHGATLPAGAPRLTYCLSPMRYLYDMCGAYAQGGAALQTRLLEGVAPGLRRWDRAAARRAQPYWAISSFVARRIEQAYGFGAEVLHPPVNTDFFSPPPSHGRAVRPDPSAPYLVVSALTAYKRVDLVIEAARVLKRRLWIVGEGPMEGRLRRQAGPTVHFLGRVSDEELRDLYRAAAGLIFPTEEDFGIVPLEAMACGRPVLALGRGGARETMIEGRTGAFFQPDTAEALIEAWSAFDPTAYDPRRLRRHAERFSKERFLDEFALKLRRLLESTSTPRRAPGASGADGG